MTEQSQPKRRRRRRRRRRGKSWQEPDPNYTYVDRHLLWEIIFWLRPEGSGEDKHGWKNLGKTTLLLTKEEEKGMWGMAFTRADRKQIKANWLETRKIKGTLAIDPEITEANFVRFTGSKVYVSE